MHRSKWMIWFHHHSSNLFKGYGCGSETLDGREQNSWPENVFSVCLEFFHVLTAVPKLGGL